MSAQPSPPQRFTERPIISEWWILAGILVLASALRLYRLDTLGLQVDEGVHALAVEGWIETGLPILPSGSIYQRSIPFVALQAIVARIAGLNEFALRLPAAVFGVAAVAATYGLARGMFDRRVALLAAAFIALSSWEIELSRYGRFYTAFQASFVVAFLCLYRMLTGGPRVWVFGFVASSLAAISLHEFSIAIAPCFLIPLFDRDVTPTFRAKSGAAGVTFVAVWLMYRRVGGPWLESMTPPHGLEAVHLSDPVATATRVVPFLPGIPLPDMTAVTAALSNATSGLHLVLVVTALSLWRIRHRTSLPEGLLLGVAAVFGVMHLFMVSLLVLFAWFALFANAWRDFWGPRTRPVLLSLAVSLGFWGVAMSGGEGGLRPVILSLFGFPNILQHFVYWFALGWPVFLAVTSAVCATMLVRYFGSRERPLLYLPGGIVIPIIIASLFAAYQESRYVFHLYPLLVVAFVWGIVRIAERVSRSLEGIRSAAVLGGLSVAAMLATGDVGRSTIAPLRRTYGEARDVMRSVISWRAYGSFHQDQVGAARYVREHMRAGDRVVAIGLPHQLHVYRFYAGRLDAALTRPENTTYQRLRKGQLVDRVTGATLVMNVGDLVKSTSTTTWVIGDTILSSEEVTYFPPQVRQDLRDAAATAAAAFRGRDGVTYVVRVP